MNVVADINTSGEFWIQVTLSGEAVHTLTETYIERLFQQGLADPVSKNTGLREALSAIAAIGDTAPNNIHDHQVQRYSQKAVTIARSALAGEG
jgi:hypothetical protein